jgi:hypothetical protein
MWWWDLCGSTATVLALFAWMQKALIVGSLSLLGVEHVRRRSAERLAAAGLETLLNAIEATDHETGQHLRRVARYALILGDAAGMTQHQLRCVERIALFHDIGKIHEALLDVVQDGARLSPEERRAILTHPQRGAEVLSPLAPFYPELPEGVLAHHERWDGTGYPRKLKGRRIPFYARVTSVADTFDVIANGRHYQRAGGAEAAALEIARERGTQFDPDLVDLLFWPPVLEQFALAHQSNYRRRDPEPDRRDPRKREKAVPDVRFRWRASLDERPLGGAPGRGATSAAPRPRRGGGGANTRATRYPPPTRSLRAAPSSPGIHDARPGTPRSSGRAPARDRARRRYSACPATRWAPAVSLF